MLAILCAAIANLRAEVKGDMAMLRTERKGNSSTLRAKLLE
jgi:hypothetical protein